MRLIFLLILFSSLATNEVLLDLFSMTEVEVNMLENPKEQKSEKENQDSAEKEKKVEQIFDNQTLIAFSFSNNSGNLTLNSLGFTNPHLEIFSPPPER